MEVCDLWRMFFVIALALPVVSCREGSAGGKVVVKKGTSVDTFRRFTGYAYGLTSVEWEVVTHDNGGGLVPGPSDYMFMAFSNVDTAGFRAFRDHELHSVPVQGHQVNLDTNWLREWPSPGFRTLLQPNGAQAILKGDVYKIHQPGGGPGRELELAVVDDSTIFWMINTN